MAERCCCPPSGSALPLSVYAHVTAQSVLRLRVGCCGAGVRAAVDVALVQVGLLAAGRERPFTAAVHRVPQGSVGEVTSDFEDVLVIHFVAHVGPRAA